MDPGARQIAMSGSDVALSDDVFSIFNNPAGLAQLNWRELGLYYSPAPFGFKELANEYMAYTEPLSFGSASLGVMSYGYDLYREVKILPSLSMRFFNKFFVGFTITIHHISIMGYGSKTAYYLNAGCLYYITNDLRSGFSITNINRATFTTNQDPIPIILKTGFSYNIINNFSLNTALEKDIKFNLSFMSGINYDITENFSLRIGFANEPSKFSGGIGINISSFNFDYAFFTHPDLGVTHQAGITISFSVEGNRTTNIRDFLKLK
jgi:hypothetical protein